jgi:hypothetical protein
MIFTIFIGPGHGAPVPGGASALGGECGHFRTRQQLEVTIMRLYHIVHLAIQPESRNLIFGNYFLYLENNQQL